MSQERMPEQVMQALLDLLAEEPTLRVGQALTIATLRRTGYSDPFNVEDEDLFKALQQLTTEARDRKRIRPPDTDSLEAYLAATHEGRLEDWLQGLSRWGHRPLALAAFAVAEPCLGIWEYGVPEDGHWQYHLADASGPDAAMKALRQWRGDSRTPLGPHVEAVRKLVRAAERAAEETGGSPELVHKRQRCVAAGRAVLFALTTSALAPAPALQGVQDEDGRMKLVGPLLEALAAARAFLAAVPGATEENAREHVRRVLQAS